MNEPFDRALLEAGKHIGSIEVWIAEDRVTYVAGKCRITFCRPFFQPAMFYQGVIDTLNQVQI
jgi:hypothetical protein